MATFKPVVFKSLKSNHIKSDGTTNIKIKIYHNLDSQYISTTYYIFPKFLNKGGEVVQESHEADYLNYQLGEIIQKYRKATLQIEGQRMAQMSCKSLKKYLENFSDQKNGFIDFVKFSNEIIAKTAKTKTAMWYQVSLSSFCWFYGREVIDARDITSSKLNEFIKQLREKGKNDKPLEPGTINNYLRGIRALFNKCKLKYNDDDAGVIKIPHEPFKKVKLPQYRRKRKNIGISELQKIRDGKYQTDRENIGRDVFLMLFYLMGINTTDLYKLEPPKNGRIEYERSKTITDDNVNNFVLSIKIEPELQQLIDKYSPDGFLSTIKNRYSDSYNLIKAVNTGLKKICDDLGIQKISTNWARHSWASLARNKAGVSKADIDFCLGHVNNDYKMADIYIDIDYSIYDRINRKVLDLCLY